jgi:hypothetical protein
MTTLRKNRFIPHASPFWSERDNEQVKRAHVFVLETICMLDQILRTDWPKEMQREWLSRFRPWRGAGFRHTDQFQVNGLDPLKPDAKRLIEEHEKISAL